MDYDNCLSQNWRINKSSVKELEFVEVLRSLKRLIKFHVDVDNVGYTTETTPAPGWTGQSYDDKPVIRINPAALKRSPEYPLSGDRFDALCGVTLHEVAHILAGSFEVGEQLQNAGGVVQLIFRTGEEIVAETYFKSKGFKKQSAYIRSARNFFDNKGEVKCNTDNPLKDALLAAAILIIFRKAIPDISDRGREILLLILDAFTDLTKRSPDERVQIYRNLGDKLGNEVTLDADKKRIADPRGKRLQSSHSINKAVVRMMEKMIDETEEAMNTGEWRTDADKNNIVLSTEEAVEVESLLAEEASDVSQLVKSLISSAQRSDIPNTIISKVDIETKVYREPDPDLVKDLQWLQHIKTVRDTEVKRAQEQGKVDKRKLYRTPVDGKIFKTKKKTINKKNIWLLMDNSSSMGCNGKAFAACAAVHQVLPEARIYIYSYCRRLYTKITRIDDKYGMKNIYPDGSTPSGNAIIFVSHLLQQAGGGVLIHFTDGEINEGVTIEEAYTVIREKTPKVGLITAAPSEMLARYYQSNHPRIQSVVTEDSQAFSRLLRDAVAELWGLL